MNRRLFISTVTLGLLAALFAEAQTTGKPARVGLLRFGSSAGPQQPAPSPRMLKMLREKKSLTQAKLADRAGVSQAYVASLESGGRKNPSIEKLQNLAKALGVPVTELLR